MILTDPFKLIELQIPVDDMFSFFGNKKKFKNSLNLTAKNLF